MLNEESNGAIPFSTVQVTFLPFLLVQLLGILEGYSVLFPRCEIVSSCSSFQVCAEEDRRPTNLVDHNVIDMSH